MTSPLQRTRQLIALATDRAASPEEARTAALAACRSIRENRLQVVVPGAHAGLGASPAPTPTSRQLPAPQARREAPPVLVDARAYFIPLDFKDPPPSRREDYAFPMFARRR